MSASGNARVFKRQCTHVRVVMHTCLSIETLAGLRHVAIGNLASYVHNRYHDFNMCSYSYMHGLTYHAIACAIYVWN